MRSNLIIWMLLACGIPAAQGQTKEVSMCKSTSIRLKAASTGAQRYEWYRNNELVVGAGTHELVVSQEGTYTAFGVNEDGCLSAESVKIIVRHHTPSAVDDIATCKTNLLTMIDVLQNDLAVCAELDGASLVITQQPASGIVSCTAGKIQFTPATDFTGDLSLSYTVKDKAGLLSNEGTVRIQVGGDALPVVLSYFDAQRSESVAELKWGTTAETNSDHFEVQRSTDLTNWVPVGTVNAATESRENLSYQLVDSLPESGLNYYRLKMVDADATFAYSRIRSLNFPEFSWAEVYPNPVEDQLHIIVRNKKVKNVRVISNAGMVRLSLPVTRPAFTISMKQYPTGMYYIHFEQEDGAVKVYKLMHN